MSDTMGGEGHAKISNAWLIKNAADQNAVFYCQYVDGKDPEHDSTALGLAKLPRGIIFKGTATEDGASATIRGYLHGEQHQDADDYYLVAGVIHPLRFKRVYASGTTARGIKIIY
jgi:hypothetical protein